MREQGGWAPPNAGPAPSSPPAHNVPHLCMRLHTYLRLAPTHLQDGGRRKRGRGRGRGRLLVAAPTGIGAGLISNPPTTLAGDVRGGRGRGRRGGRGRGRLALRLEREDVDVDEKGAEGAEGRLEELEELEDGEGGEEEQGG